MLLLNRKHSFLIACKHSIIFRLYFIATERCWESLELTGHHSTM